MKKGRVFGTIVFEESLVNDPSANIAYIYWGSLWEQTCCSMVDAELQLKHAPASKNSDINKTKNIKQVTRCRDSRSAKKQDNKVAMIA